MRACAGQGVVQHSRQAGPLGSSLLAVGGPGSRFKELYARAGAHPPQHTTATGWSASRQLPGFSLSPAAVCAAQVAQCRAIKAAGKDYYRILGVPRDCDDSQLKKAYRKLAVKLHPDKNTAPGADEAFKAVGAAYATLSDGNDRADYDRYGADGPQMQRRRQPTRGHGHGDIDPEDIFNMFFGMQPQGRGRQQQQRGNTYVYQQGQQQTQRTQGDGGGNNGNFAQLVQLMPLLLLFLFSFLGNNQRDDMPFRLQRTPPEFTFRRETVQSGTPYYVKADFEKLYVKQNRHHVRHALSPRLHHFLCLVCVIVSSDDSSC